MVEIIGFIRDCKYIKQISDINQRISMLDFCALQHEQGGNSCMKYFKAMSGLILASLFMASNAFAGVVYQYTSSGQYGQVGNGNLGMELTVDGAGVSEVVHLVYFSYTYGVGFSYWYGDIPADAVAVTGVASMAVQLDSCTVKNVDGCGYVDVTITTDEPASGWVYTGAYQTQYGDMIIERIGNSQVRWSSAVGTILGRSVEGMRAGIGKYNNVKVTVSLP